MAEENPIDLQMEIDDLRNKANFDIALPKGVAVGLLVGIEDVLANIRYMKKRMRTLRDFRTLDTMEWDLTGPRDRLLRVIRGEQ